MLGHTFTVIGILDSEAFNKYKDMDDEKLTPVDTVKEKDDLADAQDQDPRVIAAAPIEAFTHLESTNTMVVPYEFVRNIGGTLNSVAIRSRAAWPRRWARSRSPKIRLVCRAMSARFPSGTR